MGQFVSIYFDKSVTADNPAPYYMRTIIKPAVPLMINNTRMNWEDSEEHVK